MGSIEYKPIKIKGLVTPSGWDENGNVTAISIATFTEDEYFVEKGNISNQLRYLLHEEVEVSGEFTKKFGRKSIKVKKYTRKIKECSSDISRTSPCNKIGTGNSQSTKRPTHFPQ